MKRIFLVVMGVVSFSAVVVAVVHGEEVKPFDFAVTGYVGYDRGAWGSGGLPEPGGTKHDSALTRGASLQVVYNRFTLLGAKPLFDFTYKHEPFDFNAAFAITATDIVDSYSFRLGLTKDLGPFDAYALLGYTAATNRVRLIETFEKPFDHGHPMTTSNLFSIKFGAFKTWGVFDLFGYKLRVGPEISVEVFPEPPEYNRCRRIHTWYATPQAGLRFQW